MNRCDEILNLITSYDIDFSISEHDPQLTMNDAINESGRKADENVKTILLKNKNKFIIYVTTGHRRVPMSQLKSKLGIRRLCFATEAESVRELGCEFGAVSPIGNPMKIDVVADNCIRYSYNSHINPGHNERTVSMLSGDLVMLLETHHKAIFLEFEENEI